ncbi:type II toxin-antitoxin system HicB family antitoxin [Halobacterium hubeiense]|uniref:type II toxin-antitoxin system HicB family antitoxin n=1 Tax=Halobacterium hubeiense TaxID=1407499 RepID=UPI003C7865D0
MSTGVDPAITLTKDDGWWIAKDTETGVSSQGRTRAQALDNIDEALDGYHGDGDEPTDEELREMGIDPENNQSGSLDESPLFD